MKRYHVEVKPKHGIFDPAGKQAQNGLANLGFTDVLEVRIGRSIKIKTGDATSYDDVVAMCERELVNPVIEDYFVEEVFE
ncbi:MAG: phosphoribosylformylglycinamidine synthase subunit PurS [Coriobacteriales bacterium]|jgi:phosphoribosylformylglycinamidine synthase|nr:phosphoribosylformylglycinamidine synthase subunit PurS [Coriobacteriales bacterium]